MRSLTEVCYSRPRCSNHNVVQWVTRSSVSTCLADMLHSIVRASASVWHHRWWRPGHWCVLVAAEADVACRPRSALFCKTLQVHRRGAHCHVVVNVILPFKHSTQLCPSVRLSVTLSVSLLFYRTDSNPVNSYNWILFIGYGISAVNGRRQRPHTFSWQFLDGLRMLECDSAPRTCGVRSKTPSANFVRDQAA